MQKFNLKQLVLLVGLSLSAICCYGSASADGYSHIQIMEAHVQSAPKGSSIQASINGHLLMVAFLEQHQNADGSVTIPEVLRPYMGGIEKLEPVK